MDNTLTTIMHSGSLTCLNPYCSGRWSRTNFGQQRVAAENVVLILIVVEVGLVPFTYAVNYSETWVS